MFDKNFFKFAIGFMAVITVSLFTIYIAGTLQNTSKDNVQAASASNK